MGQLTFKTHLQIRFFKKTISFQICLLFWFLFYSIFSALFTFSIFLSSPRTHCIRVSTCSDVCKRVMTGISATSKDRTSQYLDQPQPIYNLDVFMYAICMYISCCVFVSCKLYVILCKGTVLIYLILILDPGFELLLYLTRLKVLWTKWSWELLYYICTIRQSYPKYGRKNNATLLKIFDRHFLVYYNSAYTLHPNTY